MRKIPLLITAVLAALAAAAPASGAVLLAKRCTTSCASFQANGKGWVSVVGSGAEYGSISSGTVWVRDRTGKQNPRYAGWVHGSGLTWKWIGDDGWKVTANLAWPGGVPKGVVVTVDPWCTPLSEDSAPGLIVGQRAQAFGGPVTLCTKNDEVGGYGATSGRYAVGAYVSVSTWVGTPIPATAVLVTFSMS